MQQRQLERGRIELTVGDIVHQPTDAIVNAANQTLLGGGGVDGAIHRAAGPELLELCRALPADDQGRRCLTGEVKTTAATGELACQYVIHAVGPVYSAQRAAEAKRDLLNVHQRALAAALETGCHSVAFPAISTGAYRFPVFTAAQIAIGCVCDQLQSTAGIELVRFVLFDQNDFDVFSSALESWGK